MADDGFNTFMRTVGKNRLLTGVEEKELARRIAKGDRSASDKMAEHNIRLVIAIAKNYARMGFDMEDLVQEGSVGLMKAVERFDPERGFKFSTYATWWIRQAIHRYIAGAGGSTIRVPGRVQKIRRDVTKQMSSKNVTLEKACEELELDVKEVQEAMIGPRVSVSLDSAAFDDSGDSKHSQIADDNAIDPQHLYTESYATLKAAMLLLTPRRRQVLELRFGFDGPPASRSDTADELGVSVKVVQKEQQEALKQIARILKTEEAESKGLPAEDAKVAAVFEVFREQAEESDDPVCRKP